MKVKIKCITSDVGGLLWQYNNAHNMMLEKYSKKLELIFIQGANSGDSIMKAYADPKHRICTATSWLVSCATKGMQPFDRSYPDLRIVGNYARNMHTLITLDPDIKTIGDLAGKQLGLGPLPSGVGIGVRTILKVGYENLDRKIHISHMKWPDLTDGLLDGKLDAVIMGVSMIEGGNLEPTPIFQKILKARNKVYFLSLSENAISRTTEETQLLFPFKVIAQGKVDDDHPAEDTGSFVDDICLIAHKDFDSDQTWELARILYEHCEEMKGVTPVANTTTKLIIPDFTVSEQMIHPGALRYYRENHKL